jgi:hypothetical protein
MIFYCLNWAQRAKALVFILGLSGLTMTTISNTCHITLTSNPHKKRVGLIPLCTAIAMGWAFVLVWLTTAIITLPQNLPWSILLILTTSCFGFLLAVISLGLLRDNYRDYVLELTDSEAILVVIDRLRKRRGIKMILLDDISYAEYYPYQDSASIIFHTSYTDMEVPLWPMTNQGRDVVDYLYGRGVKIVNVQSDDPVPD